MDWYKTIKRYYDMGLYTKDVTSQMYIGNFVEYGKITAEQYRIITNDVYGEPETTE